jgi:cytochrome bd-type quinol oxidase subunit 2
MSHPHLIGAILFSLVALVLIIVLIRAIQRGTTFGRWHIDIEHHRKRYLATLIATSMLAGACLIAAAALMREGGLGYLPPIS